MQSAAFVQHDAMTIPHQQQVAVEYKAKPGVGNCPILDILDITL
jgi:hypothetical protein